MAKVYVKRADGSWRDVCDCYELHDIIRDPNVVDVYIKKADGTFVKINCSVACGSSVETTGAGAGTIVKTFELGNLAAFTSGAYVIIQFDAANVPDKFVFTATDKNDPVKTISYDIGYRGDAIQGIGSVDSRNKAVGFGYGLYQMFLPPIGWGDTKLDIAVTGDSTNTGWFVKADCAVTPTVNRYATLYLKKKFPRAENQDDWTNTGIGYNVELSVLDSIGGSNVWESLNPSKLTVGSDFIVPQYSQSSEIPSYSASTFYYKGDLVVHSGTRYRFIGTPGVVSAPPSGNWSAITTYAIQPSNVNDNQEVVEDSSKTIWPNAEDNTGIRVPVNKYIKIKCNMTGTPPAGFPRVEFYNRTTGFVDASFNFQFTDTYTAPLSLTTNQQYDIRFEYIFAGGGS